MAVVTQGDRTYQASDLANTNRRRFIDDAREGVARLRDRDGMGLVMLPEAALATLSDLRTHFVGYLSLENAVRRPRDERRSTDFGEMAWAAPLDDDDLDDLIAEFRDALATAAASRSVDAVEELLHAWRATAAFAGDADAMARLRHHDPDDMVEVPQPRSTEDGD